MKRSIELVGIGKSLEITKAAAIKIKPEQAEFVYLDKLQDGTWRIVWTESTIPDMALIEAFKFVRHE